MTSPSPLSSKGIPTDERLILALDVSTPDEARALVTKLGDAVKFYKLGLQLFMAGGYFELIDWLHERGKQVFVDLKFFDVPETVAAAVRQLDGSKVSFATVHGNDAILEAACRANPGVRILAVTVLTSLDQGDLDDLGFETDPQTLVLSRARRALEIGCGGIISSGLEVPALRRELGDDTGQFMIVVPGIRPVTNQIQGDDQKRTVNVEEAFRRGADYIVVGRPIRTADDPVEAAEAIQRTIASVFEGVS